mmetsp:Transcript_43123/g.69674  ORF Transcript_43123/g.69674 Transcript_43123/m.69674 type:complete len:283 (+) Transcript_43123:246-1094(+)
MDARRNLNRTSRLSGIAPDCASWGLPPQHHSFRFQHAGDGRVDLLDGQARGLVRRCLLLARLLVNHPSSVAEILCIPQSTARSWWLSGGGSAIWCSAFMNKIPEVGLDFAHNPLQHSILHLRVDSVISHAPLNHCHDCYPICFLGGFSFFHPNVRQARPHFKQPISPLLEAFDEGVTSLGRQDEFHRHLQICSHELLVNSPDPREVLWVRPVVQQGNDLADGNKMGAKDLFQIASIYIGCLEDAVLIVAKETHPQEHVLCLKAFLFQPGSETTLDGAQAIAP